MDDRTVIEKPVGRQIVLEDYKFDPTISAKLRHADSLLPRAIYGSFAWKRYATPHSSFTNLCDDAIYSAAFHQLVVAAARFELDGNTLPNEFWRITDELAALFDVADDYADWRRDPS